MYTFRSATQAAFILIFSLVLTACGGESDSNGDSNGDDTVVVKLSSIALSSGVLSPAFNPEITQYTVVVNQSSITLTTGDVDLDASIALGVTITVDGKPVIPGRASGLINLNEGNNAILVFVSTSDGSASKTYRITVYRQSSDNSLSDLTVFGGTTPYPPTSSGTTYSTTVPNSVTSVDVSPVLNHTGATVSVKGVATTSGGVVTVSNLGVGVINSVPIVVTAENGESETYDLQVIRLSNNDILLNLAVVGESFDPLFNVSTKSYALTVITPTIRVIATAAIGNAGLTAGGQEIASGIASDPIPVAIGENEVDVVITSEDGSQSETYTLNVYRKSNVADLSALAMDVEVTEYYSANSAIAPPVTAVTLVPAFDPAITSYTATVANEFSSIFTTPAVDPANKALQITVNGAVVESGVQSDEAELAIGDTTISIEVTAEDGITTKTYAVTVRRQSSDATLAGLTLSAGTLDPEFDSDTDDYDATVVGATDSITVTPTSTHADATITVEGIAVASGAASGAIDLEDGSQTIEIVVTAEDIGFSWTYKVNIYRQSADASLSALSLSEGALSPDFETLITTYTTAESVIGESVIVFATPTHDKAVVEFNASGDGGEPDFALLVEKEGDAAELGLEIDGNTIEVVVTSEDGTVQQTYTIAIDRLSNVAELSSLSLSDGSLSPGFSSNVNDYNSTHGNAIDSITATPVLSDSNATMTVQGSAHTSGTPSASIDLPIGSIADVVVVVTAEDAVTVNTYTVSAYRQSNDATLSDLQLTMGELDQAFSETTTAYGAQVDYLVPSVGVIPVASKLADDSHPGATGATIEVESVEVASGQTSDYVPVSPDSLAVISVDVTAEDGITEESYTVLLVRQGANDFAQQAYAKASNSWTGREFGYAVSLSGDTLAVGAPGTGGGDGSVYIFTREGAVWSEDDVLTNGDEVIEVIKVAVAKVVVTEEIVEGDMFGSAVSLDGNTLAVGAPGYVDDMGAVYIFVREDGFWSEEDVLTAYDETDTWVFFGAAVSLQGGRLAVGAPLDDADSAEEAGSVYIYDWDEGDQVWVETTRLDAGSTAQIDDEFGSTVALNGSDVAIGAPYDISTAIGINGSDDNSGDGGGAVYIFNTGDGQNWTQSDYIKASNPGDGDRFGDALAFDGDTLAAGAPGEGSDAVGVTPDHTTAVNSNTAAATDIMGDSGSVYVFTRSAGTWTQQAYVKASNTGAEDAFGRSVAVHGDLLAVGAASEGSSGTGINGATQGDNTAGGAGAVFTFTRDNGVWTQQDYIKASNTGGGDQFGHAVAISGDTLAIAAPDEDSNAVGVTPDHTTALDEEGEPAADMYADDSGAVYIFQ